MAAPACRGQPIQLRDRSYAEAVRSGSGLLDSAEWVYIRRGPIGGPFQQGYTGPFHVLDRLDTVFKLQVGGKVETVSADRLKPHMGSEPLPGVPRRRGRPPGSGGNG